MDMVRAMEAVLREAVEEAEFTRLPKDVAYCQTVANRLEEARGHEGVKVRVWLENGRVMSEAMMERLPRFK